MKIKVYSHADDFLHILSDTITTAQRDFTSTQLVAAAAAAVDIIGLMELVFVALVLLICETRKT